MVGIFWFPSWKKQIWDKSYAALPEYVENRLVSYIYESRHKLKIIC